MSKHVTVINPDDPHGSPSYEGPADEAHTRLKPGGYRTTDGGGLIVSDTRSMDVLVHDLANGWN
jgi:hypothetical protein